MSSRKKSSHLCNLYITWDLSRSAFWLSKCKQSFQSSCHISTQYQSENRQKEKDGSLGWKIVEQRVCDEADILTGRLVYFKTLTSPLVDTPATARAPPVIKFFMHNNKEVHRVACEISLVERKLSKYYNYTYKHDTTMRNTKWGHWQYCHSARVNKR